MLTGLEAFVIHAFCTWCLAQAGASLTLGIAALIGLRQTPGDDRPARDLTRRAQRQAARELAGERGRLRRNGLLSAGAMGLLVAGLLTGGAVTTLGTPSPQPSAVAASILAPSTAPRTGSGPVTVVEFADYQCPACAAVAPELQTLVNERRITLVFRSFPLPQHANAVLTAHAAEAAALQGKFWPMHDQLFATQAAWENLSADQARSYVSHVATSLGLDVTRWQHDLDSSAVANAVASDLAAAEALSLPGTPSLFINGHLYSGGLSLDQLRSAVVAAAG